MTLAAKPHAFIGAILSPKHARELTPSLCLAITSALAEQAYRKDAIPYTSWITEAWRVLGWSEPSAALFWEITTMYHTLYLANRAHASDFQEANHIPPILSCGSTSSMGSGTTHHTDRPLSFDKKKLSTSASAKELPVWLVGTFLLLHCEEMAFLRNLSGQDERRFYGKNNSSGPETGMTNPAASGKVDFSSLLKHPSLSPRTRLHAAWSNDNSHCTAYLLRQLRKVLLLSAVSHNPDAVRACMHLAAIPSPAPTPPMEDARRPTWKRYSTGEIHRHHDEEHGSVGLSVRLTMEDLERLHFLLQPQGGGGIDEPPLRIGEFLWGSLYSSPVPPTASIPLGDAEREIRRHLELELLMASGDQDSKEDLSADDEEATSSALANLALTDKAGKDMHQRGQQPGNGKQKELRYMQLRGTTVLLKPHNQDTSSGASDASGDPHMTSAFMSNTRLHDVVISDCSDVHIYLLQPFEHATIAACTGCTIVVGAVAGMLHVVDCEKTKVTSAARRVLISNSSDVLLNVFTPSPPLLVGDNRTCQLAPYNTYYDGFREDLLSTGLGASVLQENQSPFHGGRTTESDGTWPALHCASNKWKQPIELSKLELPHVPMAGASSPASSPGSPTSNSSPGADDKAVSGGKPGTGNDAALMQPVLLPPSEFHVLFVPWESEAARQRRLDSKAEEGKEAESSGQGESQYSRLLAEVLQLSPFRLPAEYERRALVTADRMRNIQQAMQKHLTEEQRERFEEELNRSFRDWLVSSGNLRQVLDLFQLEKANAGS
ncbi:TBCC domain containing 1 [Seminavis robusta]|uniref:TBCC domain containing 1 n=1 Tax=Seminavis robusta TaxID=568900 RepID=A0A9N8E9N3_9STRA|nr:TBCC domain containing 1 [Seminavis robusta]|eukprot:Sro648_g181120.1 TBCC domain containing 1 (775) ;mRNA; r:50299-52958